jgi:hypothetical protein
MTPMEHSKEWIAAMMNLANNNYQTLGFNGFH